MKEIKFLLTCLSGAVYASMWWLAFTINIKLLSLAVVTTVVLCMLGGLYVKDNW